MTRRAAAKGIRIVLWVAVAAVVPACSGDGGSRTGSSSSTRRSPVAEPWVWQNPLPQGNHLWQADFSDDLHGWAVASSGCIVTTSDGGAAWSLLPRTTTKNLHGVDALPSGSVWAVGEDGTILKSTGGGAFAAQSSGTLRDLWAVRFVTEDKGWAAGDNVMISTVDGGATWTPLSLSSTYHFLTTIVFVGETGWASGEFTTFKTVDGGETWTPFGPGFPSLSFVDEMNGWAASGTGVSRTSDGGATWTRQVSFGDPRAPQFTYGVSFDDLSNGWATGEAGLWHTADGGATWTRQGGGRPLPEIRSVTALGDGRAVAIGRSGLILRTTDHGTTWVEPHPVTRSSFHQLVVLDGLHAWALGSYADRVLLYTGDGGTTWIQLPDPTRVGFHSMTTVWDPVACETILWATSERSVYRSRDFGQTWTSQLVAPVHGLWAVSFPDPQHGWVAGSTGMVFATADGGATWTEQASGATSDILNMKFADANTGWLASGGKIVATKDGGATWTTQVPSFEVLGVQDLAVVDPMTAWVCGHFRQGGVGSARLNVAYTTDGGATWIPQQVGTADQVVSSLSFVDRNRGWLLNDDGSVYASVDGGAAWTYQSTPSVSGLWKIRFADPSSGWLIGFGGIIMKTKTGGE